MQWYLQTWQLVVVVVVVGFFLFLFFHEQPRLLPPWIICFHAAGETTLAHAQPFYTQYQGALSALRLHPFRLSKLGIPTTLQ